MVKINQTEPPIIKSKTAKGIKDFKHNCYTKSVAIMVERFVQSIANINDSGSFDTSFEVKTIQPKPAYIRHRCVTELDRESLNRFVKAFEERNTAAKLQTFSTNQEKISQLDIVTLMASTPVKKSPSIDMHIRQKESAVSTDSDIGSSDGGGGHDEDSMKTPKHLYINKNDNLKVTSPNCKSASASKVLQFFSSAKKKVQTLRTPSRCSSATASPVMMRARLGCNQLHHFHDTDADEEDNDDGISLTVSRSVSRNTSPDSSFEMQPPLVPTFKITPPRSEKAHQRNRAYELARIIRGSFHAKRASVSKLRRSLSDPDRHQTSEDADVAATKQDCKNKFVKAKRVEQRTGVGDATIKNLDVIRVSHF